MLIALVSYNYGTEICVRDVKYDQYFLQKQVKPANSSCHGTV